jgi:hypothetical protein
MTYRQPYPWTPMHPNVPMLGQADVLTTVAAAEDLQRQRAASSGQSGSVLKVALVVASVIAGLAVASWATAGKATPNRRRRPVRRNRTSRRSRTSRKRRSRRTSRSRSGRLTAAKRARIPRRYFVFPDRPAPGGGKGTFPLDTAKRARSAISYLQMGRVRNASDFNAVRSKIIRLWPDVWATYGRGKVTWQKTKRAKAKRARRRARTTRRRRAA